MDRLRVKPTPYTSLGQSVHKALEQFHQNKYDGEEMLLECYDSVWGNDGFANPQQSLDFYNKGRRMLQNYWIAARDAKTEIVYVEKEFIFKLGKNTVRGLIDRIDRHPDGSYEVIDYKTHAELWDKKRVDCDLQLTMYYLGCREAFNIVPEQLSIYFLAHGQKISTTRSPEQLKNALALLREIAEKITRREFDPRYESCKSCDLKDQCNRKRSVQ
jgi:putative RecB family exonuclease